MISVKTTGTLIKKAIRYVQVQVFGPGDVREAPLVQPFGIDANPVQGMQAIYGNTTAQGANTIIGFINTDALAGAGEIRIYSVPEGEGDAAYVWAKADGTLEQNGDADFAVLFNKLKIEFNALKDTVNNHISAYNSHIHITTATVGATPTPGVISPTTSTSTPSSANIDNAKNSRIKTNS